MTSRYADAEATATVSRDLFAAHEHAEGARMMWLGVRIQIAKARVSTTPSRASSRSPT